MKYIHLFLASSIVEFAGERNELGNYLRSLNDLYMERGIYFKLTICEDLSSAVELEGKQKFYNSKIREADYFFVIFGGRAGAYTLEEFDVAMEQFRATGAPRIFTYFRQLPESETSQDVRDFMQRLDRELGHYYSLFSHLDSIKLNMLLEFARDPRISSAMVFEDGHVCVDGEKLLSLENIPVYARHSELHRNREELQKLDAEFSAAAAAYSADPSNTSLLQKMLALGQKRGRIADLLHQMEKDLLELCTTVSRLREEDRPLNWWEREASRLLDLGDREGALQILRDTRLEQELMQAKEVADAGIDRIKAAISAKKMRIKILKTKGINPDTAEEICKQYEECIAVAQEYHIEMDCLQDYASFLSKQNRLTEALAVITRLVDWYHYCKDTSNHAASALMLQAILYAETEQFSQAEKSFLAVRKLYKDLAAEDPEYLEAVANTENSLGMMHCTCNHLETAEQHALSAVVQYRHLVKETNRAEHRAGLANACDTLSQIYQKLGRHADSAALGQELYSILKELAQKDPDTYLSRYAASCAHHSMLLPPEESAKKDNLLQEAKEIYEKLAKENPHRYLPKVVWILYLQAGRMYDYDNKLCKQYYSQALELLLQLPESVREHCIVTVTKVCSNLGVVLAKSGDTAQAEEMFLKVLTDREALYATNPQVYALPLGDVYINLMIFYKSAGDYQNAMLYAQKATALIEPLATGEVPPADVLSLLGNLYMNLGNLYSTLEQREVADTYYLQGRYIFRQMREMFGRQYDHLFFQTAVCCSNIYDRRGDEEQAERILQEAYEYYLSARLCQDASQVAALLCQRLDQRQEFTQAEKLLRQILPMMEEGYNRDPQTYGLNYAQTLNNLAAQISRCSDAMQRVEELSALYHESLEIFCQLCESGNLKMAQYINTILRNLKNAYQAGKDFPAYEKLLETMLVRYTAWAEKEPQLFEPQLAVHYYDIANYVSNQLHDPIQGKEALQKALALASKHPQMQQFANSVKKILQDHFS